MCKKILVLFFGLFILLVSIFGNGRIYSIEATQSEIVIDSIVMIPVTNCFTNTDGELHIYASLGVAPLEYSLNGSAWQANGSFTGLTGGTKNISIREISNTIVNKDTTIAMSSPPQLLVEIIKTDIIDTLGSVTINASGGTGILDYYLGASPIPSYSAITNYPNLDTGLYYLSVRDANSCSFDTTLKLDSIVLLEIDVTILKATSKCHPDNGTPDGYVLIDFISQINVTLPLSYYLLGRNGNNIIFENISNFNSQYYNTVPADTFDVLIIDNSSPQRYYQDTIVIAGPDPIMIGNTNIVTAGCLFILDGKTDVGEIHVSSISGGTPPYYYNWEHEYNTSPDVTGVSGGTYTITIKDNENCESVNPIFVPFDTAKQVVAIIDSLLDRTCYGMDYLLEANVSKADNYIWEKYNPSTFIWDTLSGNVANPKEESWYRIVASNSDNCMDMDSVYLFLHPRFVIDIDNDSVTLFTNETNNYPITVTEDLKNNDYILTYAWSAIGDGINYLDDTTLFEPQFIIPDTQNDFIYVLTATSDIACIETDTFYVFVTKAIRIRSDCSPNNDMINDTWFLDFSRYYKTEIIIFSRWGEIIFHQEKQFDVEWDGNINGQQAPMGTYYYVVNIDMLDNKIETRTGPVTIVR